MGVKVLEVVDVQVVILKTNPPTIVISALGKTSSASWTSAELQAGKPAAAGQVQDFDFLATPPKANAAAVISEITAVKSARDLAIGIAGIRVNAANNSIEKVFAAARSENMAAGLTGGANKAKGTVALLTGVISRLGAVSFCMDGATHLVHTPTGATRLRAATDEVHGELERLADGKTVVSLGGYLSWAPECMHLVVYQVTQHEEMLKLLEERFVPFPMSRSAGRGQ